MWVSIGLGEVLEEYWIYWFLRGLVFFLGVSGVFLFVLRIGGRVVIYGRK